MCFFLFLSRLTFDQNCLADKKRNKKKKGRAKQGEETARSEVKEMESKQDVESGAEETASEAGAQEDEGRDHCVVHLAMPVLFTFWIIIQF